MKNTTIKGMKAVSAEEVTVIERSPGHDAYSYFNDVLSRYSINEEGKTLNLAELTDSDLNLLAMLIIQGSLKALRKFDVLNTHTLRLPYLEPARLQELASANTLESYLLEHTNNDNVIDVISDTYLTLLEYRSTGDDATLSDLYSGSRRTINQFREKQTSVKGKSGSTTLSVEVFSRDDDGEATMSIVSREHYYNGFQFLSSDEAEASAILKQATGILSDRERLVVAWTMAGRTDESIARRLHCRKSNIYNLRTRAFSKLRTTLTSMGINSINDFYTFNQCVK